MGDFSSDEECEVSKVTEKDKHVTLVSYVFFCSSCFFFALARIRETDIFFFRNDGQEFIVQKEVLQFSGYFKRMIQQMEQGQFQESLDGRIELGEFDAKTIERVVEYLCHKHRYANSESSSVPEFHVELHESLKLLTAAYYFEC